MKKTNILLAFVFTVAYAVIVSLEMICLLNLLSVAFAISLDDGSVVQEYPRFIPFCVALGLLALAAGIILFVFNFKLSEKLNFTKKIWRAEIISALFISIPLIKLWEMLFGYLQKVF